MKNEKMKVVHSGSGGPVEKPLTEAEQKLYKVLEELPKPTASMKLTTSQKKWWYWFGVEFLQTKQLTQLDLIHLQNAAVSMDARCKMIEKINKENKADADGVRGWVQKFASGATNVTGYQTMYEKATKQLDEVSAHFGLSIRDRQKIEVVENSGGMQMNLLEAYFGNLGTGTR